MKWKTPEPRPYYAKYKRLAVKNDCGGWFVCYELPGDVTAICEPQHLQEVNVYIIKGRDRALLLDTGMGIRNIEPLVRELWPGELTVVNCHRHFDHTGNNWRFHEVLIADEAGAVRQAGEGCPKEPLKNQTDPDMFLFDYPEGFDPDDYWIRPFNARVVEDGHIFDLGDRKLEVIETPGHTPGDITLFDRANGLLFSGDCMLKAMDVLLVVPQTVSVECDARSMHKLTALEGVKGFCSGHDQCVMPRSFLQDCADCADEILAGTADCREVESGLPDGEKYCMRAVHGDAAIMYRSYKIR